MRFAKAPVTRQFQVKQALNRKFRQLYPNNISKPRRTLEICLPSGLENVTLDV